ncbi:hypothetical protein, variant 1 [Aphanomyces invadans]|uniref:PH domain-containing protein n=1 Tax=Aphanomyces invadans TaxID=157072 RepID=A0A024UG23_9STRA|nr:hypothetical protein, variant 1 [Aphanomyces invadans]ETW04827.1 hypothetical protein, variant 1 [Aphanomyces invadans]|eukprot:XP_008866264.1 hypothetical protein, variant 1 [Aphanomyces invadans]
MRRALSRSPRKSVANDDVQDSSLPDTSFAASVATFDPSPSSRTSSHRHQGGPSCRTLCSQHSFADGRTSTKNQSTRGPETATITDASLDMTDVDAQPSLMTQDGPLMCGYLNKLSTGKWKRRRWRQRWFELNANGELVYFKFKRTARRQASSPQGSYSLHETGARLTIQVDLPRGTPTPFCFAVTVGGTSLLVCADSEHEFRDWTNMLSNAIDPSGTTGGAMEAVASSTVFDELMRTELEASNDEDSPTAASPVASSSKATKVKTSIAASHGMGGFWSSLQAGDVGTALGSLAVVNAIVDGRPSHDKNVAIGGSAAAAGGFPTARPTTLASPVKPPVSGTVNGSKAVAGCSMKECPTDSAPHVSGCWTQLHASRFNVRKGPSYRRTKTKAPSAPALLTLMATDAYRSCGKIDNIGSVVDLPSPRDGNRRDFLIINCQVPCYPPSNPLWGDQTMDGDGFNFVTYFAIPPDVRAKLDDPTEMEPPIKLLRGFLEEGNAFTDRLKAIGIVVNPEEQNVGRMEKHLLETYNGQPILTRPQHRFYRGDGYFEVDIDAHLFNFVARKGLSGVADHFGHMIVDFGFVLEGQEDDEVPEQILGCVRLCKVDLKNAPRLA